MNGIENRLSERNTRPFGRRIIIFSALLSLSAVAVILLSEAVAPTTTFYDVEFPAGEVSFADTVVSYEPIIYLNDEQLPNVREPFNNPVSALGTPNSTTPQYQLSSLSARHDVALGLGGSITLRFTNNALTGSGDIKPDLWIFEAGEKTESVLVEISKNGKTWQAVGRTDAQHNGIDIDAFGWGPEDYFAYVRLTDDPAEGEHDGVLHNGQWIGWGGADIDAVGAISSVSLISTVSHSSPLTMPFAKTILWIFVIAIAGVGIGYVINVSFLKQKSSKNNF
ncbi:MAG: hypothetical protein HC847_05540 [Hydrococcus sp. RU_2_2]|nr:hypothetical protein [Hydrococcus sp. RU_2_2]NJP18337.1 hypothetical protein [Hydrococcus sp. CRU_1_1]